MASNTLSPAASIRSCGVCSMPAPKMVDPRGLPCGHIYCQLCLVHMSEKIPIKCSECAQQYDADMNVDDLFVDYGPDFCCKPCKGEGVMMLANKFCKVCNIKMCSYHIESHNEVLPEHGLVDVESSFSSDPGAVGTCGVHTSEAVVTSCVKCLMLFCPMCLDDNQVCDRDNGLHRVLSIPRVWDYAKENLTQIADEMENREKRVDDLLFRAKDIRAELELNLTTEISKLENSRDNQLREIREKYDRMEKEVRNSYMKTRNELDEYLDRLIKENKLPLQESRSQISQLVDSRDHAQVVSETKRLREIMEETTTADLPSLTVERVKRCEVLAESRQPEIEVEDGGLVHIMDTCDTRPTGMRHTESVGVSEACYSVEYYEGALYIGKIGGVDVIRDGECTHLISLDGYVYCVKFHMQSLYLLRGLNGRRSIRVYQLNGKFITSWNVEELSFNVTKFSIHSNTVCVPNRSKNAIQLYSLDGDLLGRDISVNLDVNSVVCLGSTPAGNLILSQAHPSLIACFDIETGDQLWKLNDVEIPGGVTSDNLHHILVYSGGSSTGMCIKVLNPLTGETVAELTDDTERIESLVLDLGVGDGDVLAVPRRQEKRVHLYQLQRGYTE